MDKKILLAGILCFFFSLCGNSEESTITDPEQKAGMKNFGHIAYPAKKCFNAEHGTFQIRFKPGFNPASSPKVKYDIPMIYMLVSEKRNSILCLQALNKWSKFYKHSKALYVLGSLVKPYAIQTVQKKLNLEKDKWTHLTLTWKYDDGKFYFQLYADGKLVNSDTRKGLYPSVNENAVFYIGSQGFSYATVDYIRVSSVVRTTDEIAGTVKSGPVADRYTLLLDQFDNVKKKLTIPMQGPQGKINGYFFLDNDTIKLYRKSRN